MTYFTKDNTEGYSLRDLSILNHRFAEAVHLPEDAVACMTDIERKGWADHCAERVLAEYDVTKKPMCVETLLAAQFDPIRDKLATATLTDWYRGSYQKRITDEHGVRYHITVTHSQIPDRPLLGLFDQPHLFSAQCQFKRNGMTFNAVMLPNDETVEEMEAFFAEMWATMRLDYYKKSGTEDNRQGGE